MKYSLSVLKQKCKTVMLSIKIEEAVNGTGALQVSIKSTVEELISQRNVPCSF